MMKELQRWNFMSVLVLILSLGICAAAARILVIDTATSLKSGPEAFGTSWTSLDPKCEMRPLEDNLCCLDSTFRENSEAQKLLTKLLQQIPGPNYNAYAAPQYLYGSNKGLQVGSKFFCDLPLGESGITGLGCQRCLQHIVQEITSGISTRNETCKNSMAMRFGHIFEPETPWGEDTTWCHLDYWINEAPPSTADKFSVLSSKIARAWRWAPLTDFGRLLRSRISSGLGKIVL